MYPSQRLHQWPLALATLSGQALAVGFGDITLSSRLGEPLHAEVAIVSTPRDTVETACFSLAPLRDSDLPVITSARLKLFRDINGYRLTISGTTPLADPVFMLALRAGCGVELQRDYVLMPAAPIGLAETSAVTLASSQPVAAAAGDTLESFTQALAASTESRQGSAGQKARRQPALPPKRAETTPPPHSRPKPQGAPPSSRPAAGSNDRLTLGAPPADVRPGGAPAQRQGSLPRSSMAPEMEERVERMEKMVSVLNDEIAKLNQALALTSEVLVAQQKLQTIQANQIAQGAVREASLSVPAAAPVPQSATGNWLELLLSALSGGIFGSLAIHGLASRRKNAVDSELPLAMLASRGPATAESPLAAETAARPAAARDSTRVAAAPEHGAPSEAGDKSRPVIELAEIMLSFGRERDASNTLAEHIEKEAPDQLPAWLMLLDLYRRGDRQQEFEILAAQIQRKFNLHVPAWGEEEVPADGPDALERHPHIMDYLTLSWGRQECLDYLQALLKDNRSGERRGFSRQAAEEIVFLSRVLENGYGLRPT